ncbi:Gfo/Idh/MocA family oxidoreductase [Roseobacter sp. YSTF-M11]|uniref:Gfo/Idh/MocA family oxidoreductase n=1 Tax=Roseobacter insulae TaxID=2859783 RepID=A0A9X1G1E0_9RHOB|nr:Gfo/Idh/MocA family oxidoreductase [Roseobacter insulae]MBW4710798.1 Gfo/Idh/MocA family oxidoreductase [Roseobacter insulae]
MVQHRGRPFRWAIFGTGSVARKFTLDLRCLGGAAEARIVASRTSENARRFAAGLGVAEVAPDYAAAARAEVDAIYIATPPALHEAHAMLGIAAGKAVLIEKPIAADAPAARRIAAAAEEAGVFCMEAMWTRFQPLPEAVRRVIDAGKLGELRGFEARFMGANKPDLDSSLFDPERGGGALLHRGIYPLSLARYLLGEIRTTQATSRIGGTGVDEDTALIVQHASGAISTLRSSLRAAGPDGAVIYGTDATLYLDGPIWRPTGARLVPTVPAGAATTGPRRFEAFRESRRGLQLSGLLSRLRRLSGRGQTRISAPFDGNGYHYEAQAVMQAVSEGHIQDIRMPLSESIEILQIIDEARAPKAAGV